MKKLLFLFTLMVSSALFADTHYTIVLDAGETTKLHLFSYTLNANLPDIHEIFSAEEKQNLIDHPETMTQPLKKLFDNVTQKLQSDKIDPTQVSVDIYGTEKMRELSAKQQTAIYTDATNFLQKNYKLPLQHVSTLSGEKVGIYYWLDTNYLAGNFLNGTTMGMLNIGNSSTDIAYETNDPTPSANTISLNLNHQHHIIFSKSFANLGQESIRLAMNNDKFSNTCYPIGLPPNGNFKQESCGAIYQSLIQPFHLQTELSPFSQQQFFTSATVTKIYDFIGAEIPERDAVAARMYYVCSTPWDLMKQEYDNFSEEELKTICAHGVFVEELFYNALRLQGSQLWITDRIERQKIDWALGAVLFRLIN